MTNVSFGTKLANVLHKSLVLTLFGLSCAGIYFLPPVFHTFLFLFFEHSDVVELFCKLIFVHVNLLNRGIYFRKRGIFHY
jgi:hypothetical protein